MVRKNGAYAAPHAFLVLQGWEAMIRAIRAGPPLKLSWLGWRHRH